jgi:hypothetical protein
MLEVTSHYHKSDYAYNIKKICRLRSEVGCEDNWNDFVVMILSIYQDI